MLALGEGEDVNDDIAEVKQEPPRVQGALTMQRRDTLFLQYLGYFIVDGLHLALGLTTTDHEVIGKAAYPAGIEQDGVNSLLVTGGGYRFMGYL